MFAFPRIKRSLYQPYKEQALRRWQKMVYYIAISALVLEGTALIEDFNHGMPFTNWKIIWKYKFMSWSFFFFGTVLRDLILRGIKKYKVLFMDISDFLLWFYIGFAWLYSARKADVVGDPNPIWTYKDLLRFGGVYMNMALMFFNWYWPPLAILTYLSIVADRFQTLLPGYEDLYGWTWAGIFISVTIFSFFFEKAKRDNFTIEYESLQKERVWKEILNEFPEGVLLINKKRDIIYVNHSVYTLLNLGPMELEFEGVSDLNSLVDINIDTFTTDSMSVLDDSGGPPLAKFRDLQERIFQKWDRLVNHFESPLRHNDYMMFKGTYSLDDEKQKTIDMKFTMRTFGSEKVALFLFSDISERLVIDSLKQTIQYKERLLATVSHELRTPLNGNINFINTAIQDARVPQTIKEKLLVPALRSARYLLNLINDILDFSQIQNQSLRLVYVTKSIVETIREALELIEIQAKKKNIGLQLILPQSGWDAEIKTDHNRLLQIILNLLSNALKFTAEGKIIVRVFQENHNTVKIAIEDTGIGIKKEDQSQLFKAFGKVDLAATSALNPQGVGLGLMISNTLAEMLGPKDELLTISDILVNKPETQKRRGIHFHSEYGKGSCFYFSIQDYDGGNLKAPYYMIPMEGDKKIDVPEFETQRSQTPFIPKNEGCTCPEILIADDDAFNILTLESILGSLNLRYDTAYNGKQAIDLLTSRIGFPCCEDCRPYTAIFLDCNMPIMDGFECASKIQGIFKKAPEHTCPIIACTGHSEPKEKEKALEAGMIDFCTKPISKTQIKEILNKYSVQKVQKMYDIENL